MKVGFLTFERFKKAQSELGLNFTDDQIKNLLSVFNLRNEYIYFSIKGFQLAANKLADNSYNEIDSNQGLELLSRIFFSEKWELVLEILFAEELDRKKNVVIAQSFINENHICVVFEENQKVIEYLSALFPKVVFVNDFKKLEEMIVNEYSNRTQGRIVDKTKVCFTSTDYMGKLSFSSKVLLDVAKKGRGLGIYCCFQTAMPISYEDVPHV